MESNTLVYGLLLLGLVVSTACTVMIRSLIKSAIALAVTSAVLTVILYLMGATLAAVLELSVCAGLITAVFVSTISLTKNLSSQEETEASYKRMRKTLWLPAALGVLGIQVWILFPNLPLVLANIPADNSAAREALWNSRQLDILGAILIVLAGVFGVVVLFKGKAVKR